VTRVVIPSRVPLATTYGFYASPTPLQHAVGPRLVTEVFRAREDNVPVSAWTVDQVAEWAMKAGGRQTAWTERALRRELTRHPTPEGRRLAARALAGLGPMAGDAVPVLARALARDRDPEVRRESALALKAIGRLDPDVRAALRHAARRDSARAVREAAADALGDSPARVGPGQ